MKAIRDRKHNAAIKSILFVLLLLGTSGVQAEYYVAVSKPATPCYQPHQHLTHAHKIHHHYAHKARTIENNANQDMATGDDNAMTCPGMDSQY
jgi:hypothetical protein